ncbi:universal stress protein [Segetibacter sp. 3557_3]|uniref:universal stress protein n=1 Tax=Segetibacter sp. 3557_3 TaxID=2547429 RepID=UPI001058D833|nr:universal stress protein [Segetibacter sp. 3557_3]TDH27254.1 universal stress protein [Segetibacter sp. 3557_3]
MNKIIAALDGLKLSESTVDYSVYLAKTYGAHIVATFLEDIAYHSKPVGTQGADGYTDWTKMDDLIEKENQLKAASITKLQARFNEAGIHYNIHKEKTLAIDALVLESCYADLVIIDGDERFANADQSKPPNFIKSLLSDTLSPVLVVPPARTPIEKIVFAYDGSPSSVYAIKQFSYLFPASEEQEIEVLMISNDKNSNHFPNHHLLKELLRRKYTKIKETIIKDEETGEALLRHLQESDRQSLVVLGAYQRSSFSRWLFQSKADLLIAARKFPVFIAHT